MIKKSPQLDLFSNLTKQKKEDTKFFDKQAQHTTQKLNILQKYLSAYLAILSVSVKNINIKIIDAYAGTGVFASGEDGSPIIICRELENVLKKAPEVSVKYIGNELQQDNFTKLSKNLIHFPFTHLSQQDAFEFLDDYLNSREAKQGCNLFFIDPFNYPFHKEHIDKIFNNANGFGTEILLFVPISHLHRFKGIGNEKINQFLHSYGITNVLSESDFAEQIRGKIRKDYLCAYYLLKDGCNSYCLFFITKHKKGIDAFLNAGYNTLHNEEEKEISLLPLPWTTLGKIIDELEKHPMNNIELYNWALNNNIAPKELRQEIMNNLGSKVFIKYFDGKKHNKTHLYLDYQYDKDNLCKALFSAEE